MMNDIFSLSRWWLLVRKAWYENRKKYLLLALTIMTLMLAIYAVYLLLISGREKFQPEMQSVFFFTGLFTTGSLFASVLFSDLSSKAKGISFLTLPASHLEKLLSGMFYVIILFTTVYTLIFYIIDVPAVKINNVRRYAQWQMDKQLAIVEHKKFEEFEPTRIVNVLKFPNDNYPYHNRYRSMPQPPNYFYYVWLIYFAVNAFYSLGSVYYGRFSFVKTTVTALGLAIVFFLFFHILNIFFPSSGEGNNYYSMFDLHVTDDKFNTFYVNPAWLKLIDVILLQYLFQPLFWLIAFIRLKEKQI